MSDCMDLNDVKDIYENAGLAVAHQAAKNATPGGLDSAKNSDEWKIAKSAGLQAADEFAEYIRDHARRDLPGGADTMIACMILFMHRASGFIDENRDRFNNAMELLTHVTTYSALTEQPWGESCDEILGGGEKE